VLADELPISLAVLVIVDMLKFAAGRCLLIDVPLQINVRSLQMVTRGFPLVRWSREGIRVAGRWSCLAYFATVGFGFILIEIAMLQRFTLFLGQPVYTLAAILASLLVWSGRFMVRPGLELC
jgi:hypothetical protein